MLNLHISNAEQVAIVALQLGIIIFAARFCGDIMRKLKMPSVLGELFAGILIGPCLLGGIPLPFSGLEHGLFGMPDGLSLSSTFLQNGVKLTESLGNVTFQTYHSMLYGMAMLGSVLLLFISGLETDLRMFIRYSVVGTIVGLGGVIVSFVFGDLVGVFLLHKDFMNPVSLFMGILCTATSVGITARILSERKKVDSPEGVTILAAAVIDDVIGIVCLAIVMGIISASGQDGIHWNTIAVTSLKCIGFWFLATMVGLLLSRRIAGFLRIFKSPAIFSVLAFGMALIMAGIFELNGLAMIIGAYVTGLSLSRTDVSFAIQQMLTPVYNLLVPVFFVVMGMLVDLHAFCNVEVLKIGLIYSAVAVAAKIVGCALPASFMNFNILGSFRIGCGMIPRGEVALIIAGIGLTTLHHGAPILDTNLFGVVIIMTLLTTLLAPPLFALSLSLKGKGVKTETEDASLCRIPYVFPSSTVADLVFQRLIEILDREGYMHSSIDKENGVIQVRRDNRSFALMRGCRDFVFESSAGEIRFIRTVMYETVVELHQIVSKLKSSINPAQIMDYLPTQETSGMPIEQRDDRDAHTLIGKMLRADCIKTELEARNKQAIWLELLNLLAKKTDAVKDFQLCANDLWEREKTMTSCLQNGIALPHTRTGGVSRPVAAIGICRDGCTLDSLDGIPTRIVIMSLVPRDFNGPHLHFLAAVAEKMRDQRDVEKIVAAKCPEDVLNHFLGK